VSSVINGKFIALARFYSPEPLDRELQRRENLVNVVFVDVVIDVFDDDRKLGLFSRVVDVGFVWRGFFIYRGTRDCFGTGGDV
jgi:hypothetical protein